MRAPSFDGPLTSQTQTTPEAPLSEKPSSEKPSSEKNGGNGQAAAQPLRLSAYIYLAACILAVLHAFEAFPPLDQKADVIAAGLVTAFLFLEARNLVRTQAIAGIGLGAIGVGMMVSAGAGWDGYVEGASKTLLFMVLFFAVAWVHGPAQRSPVLSATRDVVVSQPAGRRFSILTGAAHGLGAFLNLAAMSLLSDMVARQKDRGVRKRLSVALMIGFTSASAWSPFYVSIAVVLTALPQLTWSDVGPGGMITAAAVMTVTIFLDHTLARRTKGRPPPAPGLSPKDWLKLLSLLGLMFAGVISTAYALGVPIPVVLALLAPPFALVWTGAIDGPRAALRLPRDLIGRLPGLRGETTIFLGANLFGVGLSHAVDAAWVLGNLDTEAWPMLIKILALALFMVFAGALGLHPVILVIAVGTVMPPDVYGLPTTVMAAVMLGTWGIGTTSAPFSATTLYVARVTGDSTYWLAWRAAIPFSIAGALVVSLTTLALWHLGIYAPDAF